MRKTTSFGPQQRGSAMTELMICMLPYTMLILGVILIGHLGLGKQEVYKAVAWTSPRPDVQTEAEVEDFFFLGLGGQSTPSFNEEIFETEDEMSRYIVASQSEDEPVLPYDSEDVATAATVGAINVVHSIEIEDGQLKPSIHVNATRAGKEMQRAGLIDMRDVTGTIEREPGQLSDIDLAFSVDPTLSEDVATALGSWLRYSRSEAGYEYQLTTGDHFYGEEEDSDQDRFREAYQLSAPEDDPDRYAEYATSFNPLGHRGSHYKDDVDMAAFHSLNPADDGSVIAPDELVQPVMENQTTDKVYWDRATLESE